MATERQKMTRSAFEDGLFDLDGASEFINMLIHGDSGCGKTVFAGSAPGRLLFLAAEPGYISAARLGAKGRGRITRDTATALAAVSWLEDGHASEFDWVVADGIGTLQNKVLLEYAAEAYDLNPAKRAHRNLPDKPDYFNAQNFMKSWCSRMVDLPCNVLFTTHSMRPDGEDGETLVYPSIQGKGYEVSNYISGLMHVIGYMSTRVTDAGEQVRRILWQHYYDKRTETRYFAKDQFNSLPLYTDDHLLPDILAMIDTGTVATPSKSKKTKKERK